jgi:hypothetical protein
MMRPILVALLLGCVIVFAACVRESTIKLTFVNESDSDMCFNLSSAAAARSDTCGEVKPSGTTVWRPECGQAGEQPLTVVLSLDQGGREVYNRTATCNEWEESGAKFTIEQRGDELVVTDSLPDGSPTP